MLFLSKLTFPILNFFIEAVKNPNKLLTYPIFPELVRLKFFSSYSSPYVLFILLKILSNMFFSFTAFKNEEGGDLY